MTVLHRWLSPHLSRESRHLGLGLLASLLVHALLLSLVVEGQGTGLPGFGLPWQLRRAEEPDLRVLLAPAQVATAQPGQRADVEPPAPAATAKAPVFADRPVRADSPVQSAATPAPPVDVIAVAQSKYATFAVPAETEEPPSAIASAPPASSPPIAVPPTQEAGETAQERALELAKIERDKQDAQRQAQRLEAEKQALARQAVARLDAARQESAKAEAAREEAANQVAARLAVARQQAAVQEATRAEASRLEVERLDAARQAAARAEAARLAAVPTEEEKREVRLRAIGRQLNEEADRRDAAEAAARRSPSASSLRRGRLFGHTDSHAELILYAEAWSRKIQLNMTFDMVREAAKQAHNRPLVTVAIRSDGSVESVTFVNSSGVPAIDEAIRRIVQSQAPYPAFPPGLQREYDVVEIRRTWQFDMAVRLY